MKIDRRLERAIEEYVKERHSGITVINDHMTQRMKVKMLKVLKQAERILDKYELHSKRSYSCFPGNSPDGID